MADAVLFITSKGFGKVVNAEEFAVKGRGGKGVTGFKVTDDSGPVVCCEHVKTGKSQKVLITTREGACLMTGVDEISVRSRTAGGVRLMSVADDDAVVSVLV
jgi:DNA gyrase subunit A